MIGKLRNAGELARDGTGGSMLLGVPWDSDVALNIGSRIDYKPWTVSVFEVAKENLLCGAKNIAKLIEPFIPICIYP